jgi:hypothetical protein
VSKSYADSTVLLSLFYATQNISSICLRIVLVAIYVVMLMLISTPPFGICLVQLHYSTLYLNNR